MSKRIGTDVEVYEIIIRGTKEKLKNAYEKLNACIDKMVDVKVNIIDMSKERGVE